MRQSWCMKKSGQSDEAKCDTVIAATCETMKDDRSKQRATFYYLVAKSLGNWVRYKHFFVLKEFKPCWFGRAFYYLEINNSFLQGY